VCREIVRKVGDYLQQEIKWPNYCCYLETGTLLTYLQFSVIKWAKQRPGQNPIDVKSDESIHI
jgi:hypothetical protein